MTERKIATSELGTQNYWDNFYHVEINNYKDTADQGEVWFGNGLLKKVIAWIESKLKFKELNTNQPVLDVGSGNSKFLFELAKLNFNHLRGVDYSLNSIKLSNLILERDFPIYKPNIKFSHLNVLETTQQQPGDYEYFCQKDFGLIFDKGTYDAICLNPDQSYTLDELKSKYKLFINSVLSSDGFFILCSCNWSYDELIKDFIDENSILKLELVDEVKQSSFVFGGKKGSTVTCLIFKRNKFCK